MRYTYPITGMHCQNCVTRLTDALTKLPGISQVQVTLDPPQVTFDSSGIVDEERLREAVASAGEYKLLDADKSTAGGATATERSRTAAYFPLVLILTFLLGGSALLQFRAASWDIGQFMADFMGGFFVVFSFFKLLDLRGFADAYSGYDVIASRWRAFGFVYPFLELLLGIAYLLRFELWWTSLATVILMLVGSVGVVRNLLRGSRIQCACLGTVFNLPMSTVTLAEDFGMAAMALIMLVL